MSSNKENLKESLTRLNKFLKNNDHGKQRSLQELEENVREVLKLGNVDISLWGKGKARPFKSFMRELISGETALTLDTNGSLLRSVSVACVDITYQDLKLIEERQVFEDGRVRIRRLLATVTEKIFPNEKPDEAARRGLKEELGITQIKNFRSEEDPEENRLESPSYPGVQSRYTIYRFSCTIDSKEFQPDGYIERNTDDGLTAFFKWKPAHQGNN